MARPSRRTSGNPRFYLLLLPLLALVAFAVVHAPVRAFEDTGAPAEQTPVRKPLFSAPPPIKMSDLDLLPTPHATPATLAPLSTDASTSHDRQSVVTHEVPVKKPSLKPLPPPPSDPAPGEGSTIRFRMSSRPIEHVAQRPTTFGAAPVGAGVNASVRSTQPSKTLAPVPNTEQRLVTPSPEQVATPTQQRTGPWRMFAESRRSGAIRYGSMPTTVRQRLDQLRETANLATAEPTVSVITPEAALAPEAQDENIDRDAAIHPSPEPAAVVSQPVQPSSTVPHEKATVEIGEGMAELVHQSSPLNNSLQPTPAATAPALTLRVGPRRVRVERPTVQRTPLSLARKREKLAPVVDSSSLVETKSQHLAPIQVRMAKTSGKRVILPAMRASTSGLIAQQAVSSRRSQRRLPAEETPSPLPELQPTPALQPQPEPQSRPQPEPQSQPQAESERSVLDQRSRSPRTGSHQSLFHALERVIRTGSTHAESREPTPAVEPESRRRVTNEPAAASTSNGVNKFFSSFFGNHAPRQSLDPPLRPRETLEVRNSEEPVRRRSSLEIPFLSTILGVSPEPTPAAQ